MIELPPTGAFHRKPISEPHPHARTANCASAFTPLQAVPIHPVRDASAVSIPRTLLFLNYFQLVCQRFALLATIIVARLSGFRHLGRLAPKLVLLLELDGSRGGIDLFVAVEDGDDIVLDFHDPRAFFMLGSVCFQLHGRPRNDICVL